MNISYFDDARVSDAKLAAKSKQLRPYRELIQAAQTAGDLTLPECSLYYVKDSSLHMELARLGRKYAKVKHLVVIGIGGSSLSLEAVHGVLDKGLVKLSVLDTVSVSRLANVTAALSLYKKASDIAVCVISKSGNTTETLANASALLEVLKSRFGEAINEQIICVSNKGTNLESYAKKAKAEFLAIPESIGGRYSVATAVGLVPLTLLRHDVDEFIAGFIDASSSTHESVVADSAARVALYDQLRYPHYNFFAFETRLEKLGQWYRQLLAESLGKAETTDGAEVKQVMVPTIATPVELHSVGQLYMSGVADVYTDFVVFDDEVLDVLLPKKNTIAPPLKGYSLQEVATAIYGGVIAAYQSKHLPYRATVFEDDLAYSMGLFMAMRLRETMYAAFLLKRNAFIQPNVELYKNKTRDILFGVTN